jgi:PPOX class probable F420-dependent enzyme
VELPDRVRTFLTEKHRFAAVATTGIDGAPHQSFVWFDLDSDDRVRLNSRSPRRWWADLRRSGRISLAVPDADDQYRWVGLEGELDEEITGQPARDDIIAKAYRYHDGRPDPAEIAEYQTQDRSIFLIRIVHVYDHLD